MSPSGFELHRLGATDSTNDWALAAAREGAPDRSVVVADFQRRGRGRLDRRWEAPAGSALLCSVLLRATLRVEERHLCAVAVGLAAAEGCDAVGGVGIGLKWPNDLVAEDRKLGGILAETDGRAEPDGSTAVVIGLGINVSWPGPPDANGTSLATVSSKPVTRDALLEAYLSSLAVRDRELRTEDGRAALVEAYRHRLVTVGRRVRVQLHGADVVGFAEGVDEHGHLVVATDQGVLALATGDVVHLRDEEGRSKGRE